MGIEGIIGQEPILKSFMDMNQTGTLGHAYVLTGPEGIGKRTLASAISKMLLCYDKPGVAPCGKCNACKSFDAFSNPNFTKVTPRTQKMLIEQIRVIVEDVGIKPAQGRKVYLIENADHMTPQAQNCLLKTLEEPPPYAVILMTAVNYESFLITIRSRVVRYPLRRYTNDEIKMILLKNGITDNQDTVVAYSEGIAGKAITLSHNEQFRLSREKVFDFLFDRNSNSTKDCELNLYLSKSKEAFNECADILESVYRDTMLVLSGKTDGLINSDKKDKILEYAHNNNIQYMIEKIMKLNEVREHLKSYMNYQLAVDMITLV